MSIWAPDHFAPAGMADVEAFARGMTVEVRAGEVRCPCFVTRLNADGIEVEQSVSEPGETLAAEASIHLPGLGLYRARRTSLAGARAIYLFELTEFGRRALDVLIRDRFPG